MTPLNTRKQIMKSSIIVLISLLFTTVTHANHIDATSLYSLHAVASVTGSTGNWRSYNGTSVDTINDFSYASDLVNNGTNESVVFNTFVWSEDDTNSTITFSFAENMVGNQPGNDLAIFSVGPATIDVTISGITVQHTSSSIEIDGVLQGVYSNNYPPDYLDTLDVILIDLDAYTGVNHMNQLTIDALTEVENPLAWPGISAVGSFNTTVVPLPLPIILFGSGLALLGFVGRRRKQAGPHIA
jgi:hypothetical protein